MPTKSDQAALKAWLDVHVPQSRDFFELLGVHKGSSAEAISARRNELARLLHPDRWATDARRARQAGEAMATVGQAHTILTTKDKRLKYLAELASGRSTCPTCQGAGYTTKQRGFTHKDIIGCTLCGGSGMLAAENRRKRK
jgi:DnaJ-class molecular chaperone